MKSNIIHGWLCAAMLALAAPCSWADTAVPAAKLGLMVFGSGTITLTDGKAVTVEMPTHSRYDYAASADSWIVPTIELGKLTLDISANTAAGDRTGTVTVRTAQGPTATITVKQVGFNLTAEAENLINMVKIKPKSGTASSYQTSEGIERSFDDNTSTIYHSSWSGFNPASSSAWPVLTYNFASPSTITEIHYTPRQDGATNGNFKVVKVEVGVKSGLSTKYTALGDDYDLGGSSNPYVFVVPESMQSNVSSVRFTVKSGMSDASNGYCFASCAEMEFYGPKADAPDLTEDYKVFSDRVLSSLAPGVDRARIAAMTDPFLQTMASMLLDGSYSSEGRSADYETLKSVETLSAEWNTPGKYYDRVQGVTGIMLSQGKHIIMVDGLTDAMPTIPLKVVTWKVPDGQYFKQEAYTLRNGVNVIEKTSESDGLAYVCNYNTDGYLNGAPDVKVHFIGGVVNGFISNAKSNEENQRVLDSAVYPCMDCVGSRVHSVWEVDALKSYARGYYVRYINVLDQLIIWEHRLLGFEKYNLVPTNKTLAYVNYDYYMYQGGMGVTFKYDAQYRCCSPSRLMTNDNDAIWGLSHEWGHQHQMQPYFCWGGLAESSNNMNSCYNVLHMGYNVNSLYRHRIPVQWANGRKHFITGDVSDLRTAGVGDNGRAINQLRIDAKNDAAAFNWCSALKTYVTNMSTDVTEVSADPDHAISISEVYSEENLAPFFMLHCYFSEPQTGRAEEDYHPDYTLDLYQALRETDRDGGSVIEKQDGVDKYELLAAAQNNNINNGYSKFIAAYPQSVWKTKGYITASSTRNQNIVPFIFNYVRKASRLTGYDLYPFFEKWGFFRITAMKIGDYGTFYYALTDDMRTEFKNDMEALGLKTMNAALINTISNAAVPTFSTPVIPNDRPLLPTEN